MQQLRAALRPYVTAGVAVVGASLIAVTPVAGDEIQSTLQHRALVDLASGYDVDPIQTWLSIVPQALANIQTIFDKWSEIPAPLAQQVLANWVQYASDFVGAFQKSAYGAVDYFLGTGPRDFMGWLELARTYAMKLPDFNHVPNALFQAFWGAPLTRIAFPLGDALAPSGYILQNLATAYTFALDSGGKLGDYALVTLPSVVVQAMGISLRDALLAWNYDDNLPVALANLINTPGAMVDALINGGKFGISGENFGWGLLSTPPTATDPYSVPGLLSRVVNTLLPELAEKIVAPGAQNIVEGGSLSSAVSAFVNQLFGGWPSPEYIADMLVEFLQTYFGVGNVGSVANIASVADIAGVAPAAGALSADLASVTDLSDLAALLLVPADIAGITGGLGADLASMFDPGAILSVLPL